MPEITYSVTQTHLLTPEQISDLMVTAFEGGIGYWCSAAKPTKIHPTEVNPWYSDPVVWENDFIITFSVDGKQEVLGPQKLIAGLGMLPGPRIEEIVSENYDAETADVLVQYALFGEIVYG